MNKYIEPRMIEKLVSEEFGCNVVKDAIMHDRHREKIAIRHTLFFLLTEFSRLSSNEVGHRYGFTHASVLNSRRNALRWKSNPSFDMERKHLGNIESVINQSF